MEHLPWDLPVTDLLQLLLHLHRRALLPLPSVHLSRLSDLALLRVPLLSSASASESAAACPSPSSVRLTFLVTRLIPAAGGGCGWGCGLAPGYGWRLYARRAGHLVLLTNLCNEEEERHTLPVIPVTVTET
jgi:hypothetical protein